MHISNFYYNLDFDFDVKGLTDNSKLVKEGYIFVCIKGSTVDGHEYISEAVKNGCSLVITEKKIKCKVNSILVKNTRIEFAYLSNIYFGKSSEKINLIGVTGTDGKTTTASIIKHLLSQSSSCGYIGTNGISYLDVKYIINNTTPSTYKLNQYLNEFVQNNVKNASVEVSSHAICNNRIDHLDFDVGVYTNLSEEHLDFHDNLESYFNAKNSFLKNLKNKLVVINNDDFYSTRIKKTLNSKCITYGIKKPSDIMAKNIKVSKNGSLFDLIIFDDIYKNVYVNLFGVFNIYNTLAAIGSIFSNNAFYPDILLSLGEIPKIEGRFEVIDLGQPYEVIVDFAHTPNAICNLLMNIKRIAKRNIILVCGSAGGKCYKKRSKIGEVATKFSSFVIFTSEDPRNENPSDIIDEITSTTTQNNYIKVLDRKEAIKIAISSANKDDIVVITGKGNESTQELGNNILEHNDILLSKEIILKNQKGNVYSQ